MAEEPVSSESDTKREWVTRETILDLTVNMIPMVMLLFFVVLTTVVNPWQWDPVMFSLMHFLTVFPFVLLGILTYVAARAIAGDEHAAEEPLSNSETNQ